MKMNTDKKINEAVRKIARGKKSINEVKKFDWTKTSPKRKLKSIDDIIKQLNKAKASVKLGKDADAFQFTILAEDEIKFLMTIII